MPNEWTTQGDNRRGYNPKPYKGRPSNSHKRGAGGRKPPKKSSGGATGAMLFIPIALLAGAAVVVLSVIGYLAHGYGLL